VLAIAYNMRGHAMRGRDNLSVDHQHSVIVAGEELFDDDGPAMRQSLLEAPANLLFVLQVERYSAAVVAVQRLRYYRIPDRRGRLYGFVGGAGKFLLWNRNPAAGKQL
jgi:hypothetical protein